MSEVRTGTFSTAHERLAEECAAAALRTGRPYRQAEIQSVYP